jgi:two-component system, cell cycle sensor histidine kinase and response regulator CckA
VPFRPQADHTTAPLDTEQLQVLATMLQVGVMVQGPRAEILFSNPAARELTGLSEDQLLGRTLYDPEWRVTDESGASLPPERFPAVRALTTGRPVHDEILGFWRPTTHDQVWLLVRADPVFHEDGSVRHVVITFSDVTARMQAEAEKNAALRRAEQFRKALDAVPAYVFMKDRQSRYTYANLPTLNLFGVTAEGLVGSPDARFFPEEVATRLLAVDARVLRGENTREEVAVAAPDGETRTYVEVKTPLAPERAGAEAPGLLGISIDVTDLRQAETRSLRVGSFYAALAQCYEAIALGVTEQELFDSVCRAAVQVGGVRVAWIGLEDPSTQTIVPVASYGDEHRYLQGLTISTDPEDPGSHGPTGTAFRERRPFWLEDFRNDPRTTIWREKARQSGWVSSAAVPLLRHGKSVGTLTMYAIDTDTFSPEVRQLLGDLARGIGLALDRMASEAERRQTEARLRLEGAALSAAASGIAITDADTRIEWVNRAFSEMTGYAPDEVIGTDITELLNSGKQDAAFYAALRETIRNGRVWRGEMVNRRKDGTLYVEESTVTPVPDEAGNIAHYVAVKQDVSERRTLEEQFRQAQKMDSVGRLAGGVAHDFNNMLSVILGHTELALTQVDERSPIYDDLTEILNAGRRSAELTRQLLAFARKESVHPKVINLSDGVTQSLKLLRRLISEDITLTAELSPALWPVYLDPAQLDQILANLCVNARDAIRAARAEGAVHADGDLVTITTANCSLGDAQAQALDVPPGDYVQLTVRDTGIGIADEVRAQIFEPFFTTKKVGEGTGLGLAMVFGAVKQGGGCITVSSTLGEGTTFNILFPRRQIEAPSAAPPLEPDSVGGDETILVVEDDPAVLNLAVQSLRRMGYNVLAAGSPEQALDIAAAHVGSINLLLTDVIMPRMNGRELSEELRRRVPGLKRLYISGYTADILSGPGEQVKESDLVQKPFTMQELAARVRAALDR